MATEPTPPTAATPPPGPPSVHGMGSVRQKVAAAAGRARALKRMDRAAAAAITLGGIGIVASVIGILVVVMAEAWPLFQGARGHALDVVDLPRVPGPGATPLATGVDDYQLYVYQLRTDGRVAFFRMRDGAFSFDRPVPGTNGVPLVAGARTLTDDRLAAATADGRVALMRVVFQPRYDGQKLADLDVTLEDHGLVDLHAGGQGVRQVAYAEDAAGGKAVAALLADGGIATWRQSGDSVEGERAVLRTEPGENASLLRLGRTERLIAGTDRGHVYHWDLTSGPRLTSISPVGGSAVTALEWLVGDVTFVAGTQAGEVS